MWEVTYLSILDYWFQYSTPDLKVDEFYPLADWKQSSFDETLVLYTHIEYTAASLIVVQYITLLLQHMAYQVMSLLLLILKVYI
jgi:hypothetical protein